MVLSGARNLWFWMLTIAVVLGACKGSKSVNELYKFPSELKDVRVHVEVDYKLDTGGGPVVSTTGQSFILNAFLLAPTLQQLKIGYVDQKTSLELPVTLADTHLGFDAIVQVPISAQPGTSGYSLHFALKEAGAALVETDSKTIKNLDALKGGVQPGIEAAANVIPLSLATTIAYRLADEAGLTDGSSTHVTAYEALLTPISARLKDVESTIIAGSTPDLATFASAVLAGLKLAIMQDQSLQTTLADILKPALAAIKGDQASSLLASAFTASLKAFATDVKTALGANDTAQAKLFTAGTFDSTTIPDPSTYVSVIFAPAGVAFTDVDATQAIGGSVVITPPGSDVGIDSYNVYFGGEAIAAGREQLLGNVVKGTSPLALAVASGTILPGGTSRFWVYPVAAGKELALATSAVIVNVGGSGGAPAAPTPVTAVAGSTQVTVTWGDVAGASSYNIYWSGSGSASTSSNKISGATSPYAHRGRLAGTTYTYVVTAVKAGLESPLSTSASAKPEGATTQTVAAPTGLAVTGGDSKTAVSWNSVAAATSYNLYWSTNSPVTTSSTKIAGVTSSYLHTGLTNGTTYYYAVTAVLDGAESKLSSEANATPVAPPAAPTGVAASPGNTQATVTWTAVGSADSYNIYWSTASPVTSSSTKIPNATSPHLHTGLTNGTSYYYAVTAVKGGLESTLSQEANATPFAPIAFTPISGPVGALLTVTSSTNDLSAAQSVSIGGQSALIISKSTSSITAMVMPETSTGIVVVALASGNLATTLTFSVSATQYPKTQQGTKLVGSSAVGAANQGNVFALALSADGNTALVGGYGDSSNAGAAWIFVRSGSIWSQQGNKLVGTGASGAAKQGFSVALSADGNTALVGGRNDNGGIGAAWVFTRSGSTWSQQGSKLVGSGASGASNQGYSVALSADGNTALIGGPSDGSSGAVWVFTRSGTSWSQVGAKIVGTGATGNAQQGTAVAISADSLTAIVGGPSDNGSAGAIWIFTASNGNWVQQGIKLVGTGATGTAYQGYGVGVSANGAYAVSAGPDDDNSTGAAWVFAASGGVWTQQGAKLVGTGATGASPEQADAIAMNADGSVILSGAPQDNSNAGAMWVFTRNGQAWAQQGSKLVGTGATASPVYQGTGVAISADATTGLIGGPGDGSSGATWAFGQ